MRSSVIKCNSQAVYIASESLALGYAHINNDELWYNCLKGRRYHCTTNDHGSEKGVGSVKDARIP